MFEFWTVFLTALVMAGTTTIVRLITVQLRGGDRVKISLRSTVKSHHQIEVVARGGWRISHRAIRAVEKQMDQDPIRYRAALEYARIVVSNPTEAEISVRHLKLVVSTQDAFAKSTSVGTDRVGIWKQIPEKVRIPGNDAASFDAELWPIIEQVREATAGSGRVVVWAEGHDVGRDKLVRSRKWRIPKNRWTVLPGGQLSYMSLGFRQIATSFKPSFSSQGELWSNVELLIHLAAARFETEPSGDDFLTQADEIRTLVGVSPWMASGRDLDREVRRNHDRLAPWDNPGTAIYRKIEANLRCKRGKPVVER